MNKSTNQSKHPEGLFVLFFTEMWERFSYYGMRAILVLYMTKALLMNKENASEMYGSYTGLVYLTPLIGGYVADRFWGNRKSIFVGGLLMALGQLLMFFSASNYQNYGTATAFMWGGLAALIIGNGFFKPNISTLVGKLYPRGDSRIDAAFTLFYMGINLGAFFSPLVCGILGDTGNPGDFKWGFLAACIGMLLGSFSFEFLKGKYVVTPEGAPVGGAPNNSSASDLKNMDIEEIAQEATQQSKKLSAATIGILSAVAIALFVLFKLVIKLDVIGSSIFSVSIVAPLAILLDPSLTSIERQRILVIVIAAFFVIFFWAAFEQAGASLTFFADEQMNRHVGINTSMGVVYSVISALAFILYYTLQRIMNIPRELKLFFGAIGAVLLVLTIKAFITGNKFELNEIPASAFNSVNAVLIVILAPLFAELWGALNKKGLEPASPFKQALGLLFLSFGYMLIAIPVKDPAATNVSMMWLIGLYLLHTIGELCLSPIGLSLVNKLSPVRFASLMMGIWFLANASANKFAGTLSGLYPEAGKVTKFMGYNMANTYDFFVLFIVMTLAASIVMFFMAKLMVRMMHGIR
jgi:proton-dependent oligopeptide transporter, POT family